MGTIQSEANWGGQEDGDPDPLEWPRLGKQYLVMRTRITWVVVGASVGLPVLVIVSMMLGLSGAQGAAVFSAVMTPLLILAHAIARHLFS